MDSTKREYAETAFSWLAEHLPHARLFACQTGYFRAAALLAFEEEVRSLLARGGSFHLVSGANEDRLIAADLEAVVDLVEPWLGSQAFFTVVSARDALFHPKTYYCESDEHRAVLLGSANFTPSGIGGNIEACLGFDDGDGVDLSVFDGVRDAILGWSTIPSENATPIDRAAIRTLEADRVVEPSEMALEQRRSARSASPRRKSPPLAKINGVPTRRRAKRPPRRPRPVRQIGDGQPFPADVVGVIKVLSRQDLKGLRGDYGTPYFALTRELAPYLPMRPYGRNGEPRIDVAVEARLDRAPTHTVSSGASTTNITHVGVGTRRTSHPDLRFNVLTDVSRGLLEVARQERWGNLVVATLLPWSSLTTAVLSGRRSLAQTRFGAACLLSVRTGPGAVPGGGCRRTWCRSGSATLAALDNT